MVKDSFLKDFLQNFRKFQKRVDKIKKQCYIVTVLSELVQLISILIFLKVGGVTKCLA